MNYLIDSQIYNQFSLSEAETYLLTEYLKDIRRREIKWPDSKTKYVLKRSNVGLVKKVWRHIRRKLL